MNDTSADCPVVIAGGGWAGLAAALTLSRHGVPVVVLESARQLGGRARSLRIGGRILDNGQHLMIGAYQSLLTLMRQTGVDMEQAFERLPLTLQLYRREKISLKLQAPTLPAPFHLLGALSGARGLSARERLKALRFSRRVMRMQIPVDEDICVQALLHAHAQTPALVRKLWEPLCVATLNTPASLASARLFVGVLQTLFTSARAHSDLLIPRQELNALLPRPAAEFLERHGASVELGQRVTALEIDGHGVRAVAVGARTIEARQVILATPHRTSRRLLTRHALLQPLAAKLAALGNEPIATVYLQYPPETSLEVPMVGCEGGVSQWIFDRGVCAQPGLMAVVISGRGEHLRWPAARLLESVTAELAGHFPHWPAPEHGRLIRDKRATFCAAVGVDALRPDNDTPINGLWLAGDYTATGLPATLESAVRSGQRCARHVIKSLRKTNMLDLADAYS